MSDQSAKVIEVISDGSVSAPSQNTTLLRKSGGEKEGEGRGSDFTSLRMENL